MQIRKNSKIAKMALNLGANFMLSTSPTDDSEYALITSSKEKAMEILGQMGAWIDCCSFQDGLWSVGEGWLGECVRFNAPTHFKIHEMIKQEESVKKESKEIAKSCKVKAAPKREAMRI